MVRQIKAQFCPKCGDSEIKKYGTRLLASGRKQQYICGQGHQFPKPLDHPPAPKTEVPKDISVPNRGVVLVTCAQNATPVHKDFWRNLLAYQKFRKAQLSVIALRYRNPTSLWSENQEHDEWWTTEVTGFDRNYVNSDGTRGKHVGINYLFGGRRSLNSGIMILGDAKTEVTAGNPLSGYESISGAQSCIIGHPKLALRTVATPQERSPKIITTTGACTVKNYTDTRRGIKGDFHHTFGATIVEIDGDWFTLRQINAKEDGSFIDLEWAVADGKVGKAPDAEVLAQGDTHAWFSDTDVIQGTFGRGGIVPTLKPKRLVWHDVHDGFSIDHHHNGKPFIHLAKRSGDRWSARQEVEDTVRMVIDKTPAGVESVVVASNHIDHLKRWIEETDWRKTDPGNMEFYLETALHMVQKTRMKEQATSTPDPFYYWFEKILTGAAQEDDFLDSYTTGTGQRFRLLSRDESYSILGVEFCFHGDKGANGSKGSIKQFSRIGTKSVIGHSHAPGIEEGCYQVGTNSFLKLDYNAGLSGWMHCDCVLYANGKRSLIFFSGKRWRL